MVTRPPHTPPPQPKNPGQAPEPVSGRISTPPETTRSRSSGRFPETIIRIRAVDRGLVAEFGREDVGSASGPASPVLSWWGRSVENLGPGLTSESADAASGCLANDLSA